MALGAGIVRDQVGAYDLGRSAAPCAWWPGSCR
jgi:hypothetical protein